MKSFKVRFDARRQGRILAGLVLAGLAGSASAHTGHGVHGIADGLAHPLGADHLLAMLSVGVWSAAALPAERRWVGPLAFVLPMLMAAVLGWHGLAPASLDAGIAASVALFGLMLACARRIPSAAGLGLIAMAASLHGLAHGAELPAGASAAGYAIGFTATTLLLHAAGLFIGSQLRRTRGWTWQVLGTGVGTAGALLLAQAI